MWEELKVYKQLEKEEINTIFKKFGTTLQALVSDYKIEQTTSIIKLSKVVNQLEQAVFIEKGKGSYNLKVRTGIKPIDFYIKHKFTMLNIVDLGDIMNNHRRTSYPLTQEWNELAIYLAARINSEIKCYFAQLDSYEKIIEQRKKIDCGDSMLMNKYELLIYAAIRTRNRSLLNIYLEKKMSQPVMRITQSEFLKPGKVKVDEEMLLRKFKEFALTDDFDSMENEIAGC